MTYNNALAGLPSGGGKTALTIAPDADRRALEIEADLDAGVAPRILDLLSCLGCVPREFRQTRNSAGFSLRLELDDGTYRAALVRARICQIPGVRRVMEPTFQ